LYFETGAGGSTTAGAVVGWAAGAWVGALVGSTTGAWGCCSTGAVVGVAGVAQELRKSDRIRIKGSSLRTVWDIV
jgi:hypothetical protein